MTQTVLICGANGLFGSAASQAFKAAGWTVRHYQRGTDMTKAAQGADMIINALNPPNYHNWAKLIPEITAQVIAAGLATGATVLIPGNVYVYGTEPGPWGANTPHRPTSRKGAIRAEMEAAYRAASHKGLKVILLRGGDYIAPESPRSFWNMIVLKSVAKGKITTATPLHTKRAYAYLPDMARAAAALAAIRDTLPAFADIPFAGLTLSTADLVSELESLTGQTMKVTPFMWWAMTMLSPFWELARELNEMRYLWNHSHSLDPAPLQTLLPDFRMTPLATILREELAVLAPAVQGTAISTQTGR